mmetsp:Transcript_3256/g.6823  ORF Transcript_3256/g.6823 Transcript_3256/m.6823 type:complete len:127 (+) Transcript_3256:250-630(+)
MIWLLLSLSFLSSSSAFTIVQTYTLYDNERRILGCCDEVRPSSKIFDDDEEEDEVEMFTPPPSDISCFLQHQATMKLLLKIISYCRFDKLHLVVEGLVQLSGPVQLPLPRYLPETHIAHLYKSNEY